MVFSHIKVVQKSWFLLYSCLAPTAVDARWPLWRQSCAANVASFTTRQPHCVKIVGSCVWFRQPVVTAWSSLVCCWTCSTVTGKKIFFFPLQDYAYFQRLVIVVESHNNRSSSNIMWKQRKSSTAREWNRSKRRRCELVKTTKKKKTFYVRKKNPNRPSGALELHSWCTCGSCIRLINVQSEAGTPLIAPATFAVY